MPRQNASHVDDPASLGRRVRATRRAAGLRLADLTFDGCSLGYLSHIERGDRTPSLQVVRELARRLDVTETWLARGSDDVTPAPIPLDEAEAALRFDDLDTARTLFEQVIASGDKAQRARAHAGLGQLAYRVDEPRDAVERLEHAVELDASLASDDGLIDTLGRAYAQTGETEMAVALFRKRLDELGQDGEPLSRLRFAVLLANALVDMSAFAEASSLLGSLLADQPAADPLTLARLQWAQSRLHAMKGEHASAARFARRALDLLEATEFTQYRSRAHHLLAFIEIAAGNNEDALDLIDRGRALAAYGGTPFDTARFDLEEARARGALGQLDAATTLAQRAAEELVKHHPIDLGRCYAELAGLAAEQGDLVRARSLYETALPALEVAPNPALPEVLRQYGELLERLGDRDAAYEVFKRGAASAAEVSRQVPAGRR